MAQDYLTMTPGSAVADTLQTILAQRRDSARQAMLDKLQEERIKDEEATSAVQRQQLKQAILANKVGMLGNGADLDALAKTDPELAQAVMSSGLMQTLTPKVSTGVITDATMGPDGSVIPSTASMDTPTVAGPPHHIYTSKERLDELQHRQDIANFAQGVTGNPELQQVLLAQASGVNLNPTPEMLNPAPTVLPYDETTGRFGPAKQAPRGTTVVTRGYPPTPPSAYISPVMGTYKNPHDKGNFWDYWIRPGQDLSKATPIAPSTATDTGKTGGNRAPAAGSHAINANLVKAATELSKAANVTGPDRASRIAAARQSVLNAGSTLLSPQARAAQNDIVDSFARAKRAPTPADVTAAVGMHTELTPEDQLNLTDVLRSYLSVPLQ